MFFNKKDSKIFLTHIQDYINVINHTPRNWVILNMVTLPTSYGGGWVLTWVSTSIIKRRKIIIKSIIQLQRRLLRVGNNMVLLIKTRMSPKIFQWMNEIYF